MFAKLCVCIFGVVVQMCSRKSLVGMCLGVFCESVRLDLSCLCNCLCLCIAAVVVAVAVAVAVAVVVVVVVVVVVA